VLKPGSAIQNAKIHLSLLKISRLICKLAKVDWPLTWREDPDPHKVLLTKP